MLTLAPGDRRGDVEGPLVDEDPHHEGAVVVT